MKNVLSQILNPPKKIAGLDIGTSSVKFMEIEGDSLENAKLANYAIEPIPQELANSEGKIENIEALAEIIRKCWKKSGSKVKNVAIALPSSTIITKKVIIPIYDEEEELKIQVESEIAKYLPNGMTLEEISLDYSILGINEQNPTEYDMLLVAAKKEKIDERIALVEAAGLVPMILDIEQYALQNMLKLMKADDFNEKTYLLLDCGAHSMKMLVFRKGELIFNRDIESGGVQLTHDLINNFSIPFAEAEKMKRETIGNDTYEIIEKTFLNNYVSEFLRTFQFFDSATSITNIDELILTGGVAGIMGIEDVFKNGIIANGETRIRTEPYVARPLHNTNKNEKISLNKFAKDETGLFLVTSLALRQFLRKY